MLKFGIVTNIDSLKAKARVRFADDEITSYWLPILQRKTLKDKFYCMVDVGEQVACLMDENSEDGVILGSIYTSMDSVPAVLPEQMMVALSNGDLFYYNKEDSSLTISCKNINFLGDILHDGILKNRKGITSEADITDKKSSMQAMRDTYNSHTHTGNQGSPTSSPSENM